MISLFDIDGVLNTGKYADYRQIGIDPEKMQKFWSIDFNDCLTGKRDTKEIVSQHLPEWEFDGTVDDFFRFWHESENALHEDVLEHVKKLGANMQMYSATNQDCYRLEYLKHNMGLGSLFNMMYSSCDIGYSKPHKKYYEYILDDLGVQPEMVLYWDDHLPNIEMALSLGIKAMHVTSKERLISEIAQYTHS